MTRRHLVGAALLSILMASLLMVALPRSTASTLVVADAVPTATPPSAAPTASPGEPSHPTGSLAPAPTPARDPIPAAAPMTPLVIERTVSHIPRSADDRAWEPVVATHPTDPQRIAVVYEHRGPGAGCRMNPTIRISRDGGRTWRSTKRSPTAGSGRGSGIHAAIAWGPGPSGRARLYWANMTEPGCGGGAFSLSTAYSDDEGDTWSKVRVERSTRPWVGGFPEIAVDRDPASPNHGTVYVAYNWLPRGARGPGFHLLASSDFGRTWRGTEIPPLAAPPGHPEWWRIAYRLRPAPDGSVYAAWYQVDMRRWDRSNIFAKGGPPNVGRLSVAIARVRFDRDARTFAVGPAHVATTIAENAFTTRSAAAAGTAGEIRPDPMWLQGFDIDRATGRLYLAVGSYGAAKDGRPRGTIRVGRSDDGGVTWSFGRVPSAPDVAGRRQSSIRPNLVAGPGYVLVTAHTIDDEGIRATVGNAYTISTDGGATWRTPDPISSKRWAAADLGGVTNGIGLRERAEALADGDVFWAYGDGRFAKGAAAGRVAVVGARISPGAPGQAVWR